MTTFVLTVTEDGHLILSTERRISMIQVAQFQREFELWRETPGGVAIIADCRVRHAGATIELAESVA